MSVQANTPPHLAPASPVAPVAARQARPLRTETSGIVDAPFKVAGAAWRYRWQMAPLVGAGGVFACGMTQGPGLTGPLLAAGVVAGGAWRWGKPIAGRMWLSTRERGYAGAWLGAAGAWSLASPLGDGHPLIAGGVLAGAVGYPTARWIGSRQLRRKAKLSATSRRLIARWAEQIAVVGPDPLLGSVVDRATISAPADGAAAFEVDLRGGVHSQTACTEAVRLQVEVDLGLPVDTVRLVQVRSSSSRIQVLITPTRHLETSPVVYPGPLWENRSTIIAQAQDGRPVWTKLADDDGVLHRLVSGTSGAGKSRAVRPLVLPWAHHGHGIVIFCDGGAGTSCPDLEGASRVYAITPDQWRRAVRGVYAIFLLRRARRGLARLTRFSAGSDVDPAVVLVLDEAGFINRALSAREEEMILDLLQQGRKLGILVIQSVQDAMGDEVVGGRKGKDLLGAAGGVVALRAGGSQASRITMDSTSVSIDLTALPDVPGAAWVLERGQILSGHPARVVNCDEDTSAAIADGVSVVRLCDEEEAALDHEMTVVLEAAEDSAEEIEESDAVLLDILAAGPKQLGEIVAEDGTVGDDRWKWSRRTAAKSFGRLEAAGKVEKTGKRYGLVRT